MSLLKNKRVYLAGPVEQDPGAKGWRERVTEHLKRYDIFVYDPLVKPDWIPEICRAKPSSYLPVLRGDSTEYPKSDIFMANTILRDLCLRSVTAADFVICYHPKKWTSGTWEEIYLAGQQNKPVLLCIPDGLQSTWTPAVFSTAESMSQNFFYSWEEMFMFLRQLDAGEVEVDRIKWLPLFYKR